jgi:hypothetical protein
MTQVITGSHFVDLIFIKVSCVPELIVAARRPRVVTNCCMSCLVCAAFGVVTLENLCVQRRRSGVVGVEGCLISTNLSFDLDPLFMGNFRSEFHGQRQLWRSQYVFTRTSMRR